MSPDRNQSSATGGRAAIASSVVPGWGHLLLGLRSVGVTLLVLDAAIAAVAVVLWMWFPDAFDDTRAWTLAGVLVANAAVLGYRAAATTDAFVRSGSRRSLDWVGGVVAMAVVIVPHLVIGGLAVMADDTPNGPPASDAAAVPTTTTTEPESTTTTGSTAPDPTTTTAPTTTTSTMPEPTTTTTTEPPRIWDGEERLNVLLLGSDAGVGRTGTRTDTVILLSVEPETGDAVMIHIPRNLTEAPLPEGMGIWDCNCFPDIITHLWANAEWYPDAFPGPQDPPVNALKAAVGLIFDLDIQYYAKVDLAGLVGMIDALGGVTIDVPKTIVDEAYPHELGGSEYVVIEEGEQHLDGHLALAYSRIRRHSGDFARMHRQRCVLGALLDQTDPMDLVTGWPAFASAVKEHVDTDIPIGRLGDLIDLLSRVELDRLATVRVTRYNYATSGHAGYQLYDLQQIREDAHALMADPTVHLDTEDGDGFEATCELSFD